MLKELSTMLGFTFNIHDNPDGKYGQNNGGTWNGMIGEVECSPSFHPHYSLPHPPHANQVVRGTADIALADMTITSKR